MAQKMESTSAQSSWVRLSPAACLVMPLVLTLALLWSDPAWGAEPYKTYVVRKYKNWDILCDTYTVQEGDHVWQLLRRRGYLVEWDLAWFTAVLKKLNPHVSDVNEIYPGQNILIPLKRMEPQEVATGGDDRSVTIPFLPDILYRDYTVLEGDYIAKIAAKYHGLREVEIPEAYFKTVKKLNPDIKDLDLIYPGQQVRIPDMGSEGPPQIAQPLTPSPERQNVTQALKRMESQKEGAGADNLLVKTPSLPDTLYHDYAVRQGDSIAKIAAKHHGLREEEIPEEYFETVKKLNPDIKDLDLIYPGQQVRIPDIGLEGPSQIVRPSPELQNVTSDTKDLDQIHPGQQSEIPDIGSDRPLQIAQPVTPSPESQNVTPPSSLREGGKSLHKTVSMGVKPLGGTLIESGQYFFPTKGRDDFKLDLSDFPVIELANGQRVLLDKGGGLTEDAEKAVRVFWKSLTVIRTEPGESRWDLLDKIFRIIHTGKVLQTVEMPVFDDGIQVTLRGDWILVQEENQGSSKAYHCITLVSEPEERTSVALRDYLAEKNIRVSDLLPEGHDEAKASKAEENDAAGDPPALTLDATNQQAFVAAFSKAFGYSHNHRAPVSFQYAGAQVQTVTDLIHGEDGLDAVVDFCTLYGDAKSAIEASGLKVLTVRPEDEAMDIARNVLKTVGISWTEAPVFFGANRNVFKATSLTIPGLLASQPAHGRTLVTQLDLAPRLCDFLGERGIRVVKMKTR